MTFYIKTHKMNNVKCRWDDLFIWEVREKKREIHSQLCKYRDYLNYSLVKSIYIYIIYEVRVIKIWVWDIWLPNIEQRYINILVSFSRNMWIFSDSINNIIILKSMKKIQINKLKTFVK